MIKHLLSVMLIVALVVLNGCASAPVKTHTGASLPPSETAKVTGKMNSLATLSPHDHVIITRIDEQALPGTREIIVLPGKHTLTINFRPGGRMSGIVGMFQDSASNKYEKKLTFLAEKGHEYLIEWDNRPLILGVGNIDYSIKDVKTNEIIGTSSKPDQKP
jgi:hypothetical protein